MGLPEKKNKKKAEKMLTELRHDFVVPTEEEAENGLESDMLFSEFMDQWLEIIRPTVEITTMRSYEQMVLGKIVPYFKEKKIKLKDLTAMHIQNFYTKMLKTVSANTVIHVHHKKKRTEGNPFSRPAAQLRIASSCQRRADEIDSGVARAL